MFLLRALSVSLSLQVHVKAENLRPVFILKLNLCGKGKGVINTGLWFPLIFVVSIAACCLGIVKELLWYYKRASLFYAPGLENRHLYQTDKGLPCEDLS